MGNRMMFEHQLDELLASWVSGNRKYVVAELTKYRLGDTVRFAFALLHSQGEGDVAILARLLDNRKE